MGGMHDFKPFLGGKIMHTTEKIAKNHAYCSVPQKVELKKIIVV